MAVNEADGAARAARAGANSGVLRSYFAQLTAALLQPFRQHFTAVPPPDGPGPVPSGGPPHLPPFSHASFLEDLKAYPVSDVLLSRFSGKVRVVLVKERPLQPR